MRNSDTNDGDAVDGDAGVAHLGDGQASDRGVPLGDTAFIDARRRGFLQGAVVAGGAAVAGIATAGDDDVHEEIAGSGADAPASSGYRLTEHVRDYYATARS